MLERVLPIAQSKIALDNDRTTRRPVSAGAFLHNVARRLARVLRAVGAFFAVGGGLS